MTRIARMKGENQPHKNVGAMPPCLPKERRDGSLATTGDNPFKGTKGECV